MDTDRNLLFGVLALQADLLDVTKFADACAAWAARKNVPLADLLVERGWLTPADRALVEQLVQRKLSRHEGNPHAGLVAAASAGDEVRRVLAVLDDSEIRGSLGDLSTADLPETVAGDGSSPMPGERYTR